MIDTIVRIIYECGDDRNCVSKEVAKIMLDVAKDLVDNADAITIYDIEDALIRLRNLCSTLISAYDYSDPLIEPPEEEVK